MKIPFNRYNSFYLNNKETVLSIFDKVLSSGKYIRDENVLEFEQNVAKLCRRQYSITTNSCTDALFFALKSIGVEDNDEVIIPCFSFIASLDSILKCRAIPVFADVDIKNLMIDIKHVESLITEKTKAILFVQLNGFCLPNYKELKRLADNYNLKIIEDAAQALGAKIDGIPAGKFGDISCISFDPTKIISAFGTGGIALTDDEQYYKKLKMLTNHGKNLNGEVEILGYNSKLPSFNAALLNLQLSELEQNIIKRQNVANYYQKQLQKIKQVKVLENNSVNSISNYHKFIIFAQNRDELMSFLDKKEIETKIHYPKLLNEYKLLIDYKFIKHSLYNAENIKKEVLSLPIYPNLTFEEIDYICAAIKEFYS